VSNVRTAGLGAGLLLGLTLSALLMLMTTASAQAQRAGSCQEEKFTVLRTHTETVLITGGKVDKERAGLLKLVTVKVEQLEAAGRISAESADLLRSDAQATIACVQGSDASTTVGATAS
jgi:hypothetical protein